MQPHPQSQCTLCQRYSADHHLLCAVYPGGSPSDDFPDFAPLPGGQPFLWEAIGARYDGQLIVQETPGQSAVHWRLPNLRSPIRSATSTGSPLGLPDQWIKALPKNLVVVVLSYKHNFAFYIEYENG